MKAHGFAVASLAAGLALGITGCSAAEQDNRGTTTADNSDRIAFETGLAHGTTVAYDSGYEDGIADGYQQGLDNLDAVKAAAEDYGYEAGLQRAYEDIQAVMASCHEDEVLTVTFECVVPGNDGVDFVGRVGWTVK